jgi:hypothetical protein
MSCHFGTHLASEELHQLDENMNGGMLNEHQQNTNGSRIEME